MDHDREKLRVVLDRGEEVTGRRAEAELLEHDVRRAVADLAARDVPVLDDDDGMLGMLGSHVVDHDLAAAAELGSDTLGNLPQSLQL